MLPAEKNGRATSWILPILGDDDLEEVTLLGKEQLAVVGKLLFPGVPRDKGEEVRAAAVAFGTQDATQPLGFFLAGAEHARHLDEHVGIGEFDGKVPDPGEYDAAQLAPPEAIVDPLPLLLRRLAGE